MDNINVNNCWKILYIRKPWFNTIFSEVTLDQQNTMVHFPWSGKDPFAQPSGVLMAAFDWQLQN